MSESEVMVTESPEKEHISLGSRFWLSFADGMCGTLNGLITGGGMSYFFTKYMGMEEGLASIVWMIFAIWNAFNDPLFGFLSDRTKSHLGRRIPYIRYGSVFYAAVFLFAWIKWPIGGSQTALFIQMLATLFLFDTLYTAIATSLYVMPYEMAVSNEARSGIFLFKIVFSLLSMAAPLIIFPLIKPEVGEDAAGFQIIMAVIGIAAFLVIFISTFFYKEKHENEAEGQPPLFSSIATCLRNKAFLLFEVVSFTVVFVQTILMQGVIYYFDEFDVPMTLSYGVLAVGAVAGILLWTTQLKRLEVRGSVLLMSVLFAGGAFVMTFLGGVTPIALLCFFLIGVGFAGGMYLIPLMNGDVIDYDESRTGLRREGMYAGVNSFVTKPAISLANSAFLMIAKWFGYDTALTAGMQSSAAKSGILVAWMAIPALLFALSALSMKWYPLHGTEWAETKKKLERKTE